MGMKLSEYIQERGAQARIAKAIVVSPVLINQWAHEVRRVPAERCPDIERATNGAVRCEELRPDVDWAYLRGTGKKKKAA